MSVSESTDKDQKCLRREVSSARQLELCVLLILSTLGEGWGGVGPM